MRRSLAGAAASCGATAATLQSQGHRPCQSLVTVRPDRASPLRTVARGGTMSVQIEMIVAEWPAWIWFPIEPESAARLCCNFLHSTGWFVGSQSAVGHLRLVQRHPAFSAGGRVCYAGRLLARA